MAEVCARRIAVFAVASHPAVVGFWQSVGYTAQSDRQRLIKNPATTG